eukprot:314254_1
MTSNIISTILLTLQFLNVYSGKYILFDEGTTWLSARDQCNTRCGTHLASIHSQTDDNEAKSLCNPYGGSYGCWLGGTDVTTEGVWLWIDNTPWNYQGPWFGGHADNANGDQHCLRMDINGAWDDIKCNGVAHAFLCTKPPSPPATCITTAPTKYPTPAPTTYPTLNPTPLPTLNPSKFPTNIPTQIPTSNTNNPTINPSKFPSINPSKFPSNIPTLNPTKVPSVSPTSANEYGITDDKDGEVIESTNVLFINNISETKTMSANIISVLVIVPLFICIILIICGVVYKIKKDKKNKSQNTFIATNTNINTNEQMHEQNVMSVEMDSMGDGDIIITEHNETNGFVVETSKGKQEEMDDFIIDDNTIGNDNDEDIMIIDHVNQTHGNIQNDNDDIIIIDDVNETHGRIQNDSGNEKVRSSFVVDDDNETARPNDDSVSGSDQLVVND